MGEVVKLPGAAMTADEALEAEVGRYDRVIMIGVTKDNKIYCSAGGTMTNQEVVYLCEVLKQDVLSDNWVEYPEE